MHCIVRIRAAERSSTCSGLKYRKAQSAGVFVDPGITAVHAAYCAKEQLVSIRADVSVDIELGNCEVLAECNVTTGLNIDPVGRIVAVKAHHRRSVVVPDARKTMVCARSEGH